MNSMITRLNNPDFAPTLALFEKLQAPDRIPYTPAGKRDFADMLNNPLSNIVLVTHNEAFTGEDAKNVYRFLHGILNITCGWVEDGLMNIGPVVTVGRLRKSGLAKNAVRALMGLSEDMIGVTSFEANVSSRNVPAIALYKGLGFAQLISENPERAVFEYKR